MFFWTAIKNKLKKMIPAGRAYLDEKLKNLEKGSRNQQKILLELQKASREQAKAIQKQTIAIEDLKQYIDRELQRRDDWGKRAAEMKKKAGDRPLWVIKCPAPEGPEKVRWGDYAYALALQKYLNRSEVYAVVDTKEDWDCGEDADVVLVLRGCHFYRPDRRNSRCLYIMWNISRPDMVTSEEYELYDVVCICSRYYAEKIGEKVRVPVLPLLQCTDTELFYPAEKEPETYEHELIFIGNSRGVARRCVMWAAEDKLPLKIWGSGWKSILAQNNHMIQDISIENSQIPDIYRSAKATLNDHWKDMLDNQFINNRIFDALACGLPVISDCCDELKEIFPDAVLYYENKEEFENCIQTLEKDYALVKERVVAQWPLIREEYSFKARAKELIRIAEKYGKKSQ